MTTRFLWAVAVMAAAVGASPSYAQYIYLDTNGDGQHTASDSLSPTDSTRLDIWLVTDRTRAGVTARCATYSAPLSIRGYEFILHATGGEVIWSAYSNAQPGMTLSLGAASSPRDFHAGFFGQDPLPTGPYRLGTVYVRVLGGTPSLSFATSTSLSTAYLTAFYSECPGYQFDNTLRLGTDWSDADGVPFGGPINHPPTLEPPAPMIVSEGDAASQTLTATDADGQSITFTKASGPAFMAVATDDPGSGTAHGTVTVSPGFRDAGSTIGSVRASDGVWYDEASFGIQVIDVDLPPTLIQPPDTTMRAGSILEMFLLATDPDGPPVHFQVLEGPPFLNLVDYGLYMQADLIFAPSPADSGAFRVTVAVSDGHLSDQKSFQLVVTDPDHRPEFDPLAAMLVRKGDSAEQAVRATDGDGDPVALGKRAGPEYVTVTTEASGPGFASGTVRAAPGPDDEAGRFAVSLEASDGLLSGTADFPLIVLEADAGETSLRLSGDPGEPLGGGETHRYDLTDGGFRMRATPPPRPWIETHFEEPCPVVSMSSCPAQRPFCLSRPVAAAWDLYLAMPEGAPLEVGVYEDAIWPLTLASDLPAIAVEGADPILCRKGSCATASGRFSIHELDLAPDLGVRALWATFEFHCDGASQALRGEVRYNAHVPPLAVTVRGQLSVFEGDTIRLAVSAVDSAGGHVALSASSVPAGASFRDRGDNTGLFEWTPAIGQAGTYSISFRGTSGLNLEGLATTTIAVQIGSTGPLPLQVQQAGDARGIQLAAGGAKLCLDLAAGPPAVDLSASQVREAFLWRDGQAGADTLSLSGGGLELAEAGPGRGSIGICAPPEDVFDLFADLRGRTTADLTVDVRLATGHELRGGITVPVVGLDRDLDARVTPNPLNPGGVLTFVTSRAGPVRVQVFDVRGRLVRTLHDRTWFPAGYHPVPIDGRTADGVRMPSGIYFYRVESAQGAVTGRLAVVR